MTQNIQKENIKKRCDALLIALTGSHELVKSWWDSPNKAFNNELPSVVFEKDETVVYQYLMNMSSGEW